MRRKWAAGALLLALGACGRAQEVTVYTQVEPDVVDWVHEAFTAAHPDVGLRFEPVAADALLDRLRADGESASTRIVWGAPSWVLAEAAEGGLLQPGGPAWASALPDGLRDAGGRWTASLIDPIVLAFDYDELSRSRAPRDWIDLLHPRFAGEVLVPEPGVDVGGTVFFAARAEASLAEYGDILEAIDWFRRLDGQARDYEPDEELMIRRLARPRDGLVAPARLSRVEAARRSGSSVAYVVPESGGPLLVEGVAIAAGAVDLEAARTFVAWLGEPDVAQGLADAIHRIPATLMGEPERLAWLPDAATALGGDVPDADSLAGHLRAWLEQWRSDARGRGPKLELDLR